jgi:hypothetical protein
MTITSRFCAIAGMESDYDLGSYCAIIAIGFSAWANSDVLVAVLHSKKT